MNVSAETRALQHLLVQGFTAYPYAAAVSLRLVAPGVLDAPAHSWAIVFDSKSLEWTAMLVDSDLLRAELAEAAVRSANPKTPHVLCHTAGARLLVPLTVTDVRDVRMRIEAAVAMGKAPAAERLEAFPDELIEREARRRRLGRSQSEGPTPSDSGGRGSS